MVYKYSMVEAIRKLVEERKGEILAFAQDLVRTRSVTGHEGPVAEKVRERMLALGYGSVVSDSLGSVLGRIGDGPVSILFDGHMDTVDVTDSDKWEHDPFSAVIEDGKLWGRGSVDMKGSLAVAVYAAAIARDLGLTEGKTVYVLASIMEEDYAGEPVYRLLNELGLRPDYAVICEASRLAVSNGHNGRALVNVRIHGRPCHASAPWLGDNPAYKFASAALRAEALAKELGKDPACGTLALTKLVSDAAGTNSTASVIDFYLDRRITSIETEETVAKEMDAIIEGLDGEWSVPDLHGVTYNGSPITFKNYIPGWETDRENPLVLSALESRAEVLGDKGEVVRLGYCTNAVATAGRLSIPSIVLGAGDIANAHGRDEFCPVSELLEACRIYIGLIRRIYK